MIEIRIRKPRQIIKHEILCPKGELEENKLGKRKWKIEVRKIWKEIERRKENAPKSINCLRQKILIEITKEDKKMKNKM